MNRLAGAAPVTAFTLLAAITAWAQEFSADWLPAEVRLPDDMEVLLDRSIGSTMHIVSFATGQDVAELMTEWRDGLAGSGYVIKDAPSTDRPEIEFSGKDIQNGKIVVNPSHEDGREVVQIDATMK